MITVPEKHVGILTDAHAILTWNSIDMAHKWPAGMAHMFGVAQQSLATLMDALEKHDAATKALTLAENMVRGAFE